ncbi:MAG: preprotein translocase subunit YajC [Gemmataceae bacterium]
MPFVAIAFFAYFFLIRPQQRQEQQRRDMVSTLKKNDRVVNHGGIIGVVEQIKEKEDEVVLKGGIRIVKSSIVRIMGDEDKDKDKDKEKDKE